MVALAIDDLSNILDIDDILLFLITLSTKQNKTHIYCKKKGKKNLCILLLCYYFLGRKIHYKFKKLVAISNSISEYL